MEGVDRLVTPGIYAIWMMLEARVKTVEAMDPTVWVEARASRLMVKSFSAAADSLVSSVQSSSSYCCLLFLIQNLHTQYVIAAMMTSPPTTPPAIAPTLGPELEDFEEDELIDVGVAGLSTHTVFWHESQVGGTREQTWPSGHEGQAGVTEEHPSTHRRKSRSSGTAHH